MRNGSYDTSETRIMDNSTSPGLAALKTRQQLAWASGD